MMRMVLAALALSTLASAAAAQPAADTLAPAREGQLQCYSPTPAKTCRALGGYTFASDGAITSNAVTVIQPQPLVVMSISSPATVRGDAVCGPVRASDLEAATFTIDGAAATPEQSTSIRAAMAPMIQALAGEICSTFTPQGEGFVTTATLNGEPMAGYSETVIWVGPTDGYAVRAP